jgi:hypothetical protein
MTEEIENWNITCNRFVAFLDIMGFRDRVYRESHEDVKKMLESFLPAIRAVEFAFKQKPDTTIIKTNTKPIIFSDSIILVSKDDSEASIKDIFADTIWVCEEAIAKGIPIKGAIAYGEFTAAIDKSLYFGRPLIDAYELQKELQLYGVVLHHTVEKYLVESNLIISVGHMMYQYPIPTKSNKVNHCILDWTQIIDKKDQNPISAVNKIYHSVSGTPRIYVDNTLKFLEWLKNKKAYLEKIKKKT